MNVALQKTLGLLLLIILGIFLQRKISSQDNLKGIKVLILSVALPATIFVALLKIELERSLILLPVLALVFNFLMLLASRYVPGFFGVDKGSSNLRTLMMLLPSLAPGLSCFPFLIEYLGDNPLALAALADVGNKIFVLILLYMLAMHWYHQRHARKSSKTGNSKLKSLLISMVNEPINIVIIVALILLVLGLNLNAFPEFLSNTVLRLSVLMTPLVLLFIGLAVRIKWHEMQLILYLLTWRSGITFCLSALFVYLSPGLSPVMILLAVVFPQSSCSFWPFAHMSTVNALEENDKAVQPTFNIGFALSVLACSLPFSTITILGVLSFTEFFVHPLNILITGLSFTGLSLIPYTLKRIKKARSNNTAVNDLAVLHGIADDLESRQAS